MPDSKHLPPAALDEWLAAAAAETGVTEDNVELDTETTRIVLHAAKLIARNVARPAAPLSTFLLGVAVGAVGDPRALKDLADQLGELALGWEDRAASDSNDASQPGASND
ncbi:hypothetical protein ICM05_06510 [Leucobacter sp. cx-42]|uniref:DUF6457 domain-containing protein n=1 Tax=unclassified Leucobacter TaxID=2621730 RepID=UPI00165E1817|nr:hypothetical protein [Leucobacter sp. cx-42]